MQTVTVHCAWETDQAFLCEYLEQRDETVTTAQVNEQVSDHLIALTHTHTRY